VCTERWVFFFWKQYVTSFSYRIWNIVFVLCTFFLICTFYFCNQNIALCGGGMFCLWNEPK